MFFMRGIMSKQIMFEVLEDKKKELSEFLKQAGFSNKYVELHFHPNGDLSFVKPVLKF